MKKVLLIVLCVVLACSAVACSAEAPAETGSAPATESVAVSEEPKETEPATTAESADASASEAVETAQYEAREPKNGDHYVFGFTEWGAGSFFDSVYGAIEEVVLQNGDEIIHLEGQSDSNAQLQVIEDFISQDVDAVFFNPVDAEACKPAVQALVDAGIPIINFDSAVADIELVDTFVATDNYKAGQIAAEQMMKDFPDGGKVAVLDYPINTAAVDRANGFIDALKGSNFEVVAQFDASGKPETGLSVTEDILQAHSDLTAIFAINDESGMGAYAAVVASGDDVAIYGVNGNPETKVEIAKADSPYRATAAQSTIGMGQQSIEVAYKILKGEEFPKQIDVAPFIINADNVNDYPLDGWQ